jgi:hypothetical protein
VTDIPDKAVYAAAEAVYGCGFDGSPQKDAWLADFRNALEAAAPHMLAEDRARRHAERVNRVTNDPHRIGKRKRIAPALTVPRRTQRPMASMYGLLAHNDEYLDGSPDLEWVKSRHAEEPGSQIIVKRDGVWADYAPTQTLISAKVAESSPRLPPEMRDHLFRILGDFMEDFDLVSRHQGPTRHLAAPGYEWGDMCGYFERRVVASIRAASRAQEEALRG